MDKVTSNKRFNVGDKVIKKIGGYGSVRYSITKVYKVHKNGNFRLECSPQQYSQDGFATGLGWTNPMLFPWTAEIELDLKVKVDDRNRTGRFRELCKSLASAITSRKPPSYMQIDILENLFKEFQNDEE